MIVVRIQMTDLVECHREPLVSRVHLAMAGLMESSAQKNYSICSLAATAMHFVLTLEMDQVCLHSVIFIT